MWSLDLGTTNTTLARWEPATDRPHLLALPEICRQASPEETLESRCLVPSALEVLPRAGLSRLLAESKLFSRWSSAKLRVSGERVRELTLTTPVDAYESYRAELQAVLSRLGVRSMRFLDEPVAAALAYGLSVERARRALVVDFGGERST